MAHQDTPHQNVPHHDAERIKQLLASGDSSDRLQTALAAGTQADPSFAGPLVERCAVEPDFYVREMLTWALTMLPHDIVMPLLLDELESDVAQARSQALHTLSKLRLSSAWGSIRAEHLHDTDDEVARTAWRTAAQFLPDDQVEDLAIELLRELGRGSFEVKRSLSRAFVELGERAQPLLGRILESHDVSDTVSEHARATLRLIDDPEASFVLE